jgi:DNA-binding beta-propeller fold protein YncE
MDQSKVLRYLAALAIALLVFLLAACGGATVTEPAPSVPDPHAKSQVRVGGTPVAVATGAGGVWVVENAGSRVIELDPSGAPVGKPIAVGAGPEAVAIGEGYVWVASGDGRVTRIDPRTHRTKRAGVRIADPGGIAAGEGVVWATSRAKGTVTRLDPRSLKAAGRPIPVGAEPADVAIGAGAAWVANTADGTVTRIDASTGEASAPIQVADYQVLGLCVGEGGVWVAKTDDRLAQRLEVVRIDTDSSSVGDAAAQIPAAIPVRVAAGEDGVWATLVGGVRPPATKPRPGQVALLDPDDLSQPARLIRVGDRPAGVAVGARAVWVADSGDGTVTRIAVGR